jgi:serine/threonine protein kinase
MLSIKTKIDASLKRDKSIEGSAAEIYKTKDMISKMFTGDDCGFIKELVVYKRLSTKYNTLFKDAYIVTDHQKTINGNVKQECHIDMVRGIPYKEFCSQFEPLFFLHSLFLKLAELNSVGIIHGDIKPQNIVAVGNELHLIDFSASSIELAGNTHRNVCTITTESPEKYPSNRLYQFDVYSLAKTFRKIYPQSDMSKSKLVKRCLTRNPRDRPNAYDVCIELGIDAPKPESNLSRAYIETDHTEYLEKYSDFFTHTLEINKQSTDDFLNCLFDSDDYLKKRDRHKETQGYILYHISPTKSAISDYNKILDMCHITMI